MLPLQGRYFSFVATQGGFATLGWWIEPILGIGRAGSGAECWLIICRQLHASAKGGLGVRWVVFISSPTVRLQNRQPGLDGIPRISEWSHPDTVFLRIRMRSYFVVKTYRSEPR
jgi:hypothetical protein